MSEHETYDWPTLIAQARHKVFGRLALLGITDLEAHIKFEAHISRSRGQTVQPGPRRDPRYCWHTDAAGLHFRPSNRHPRYHNLYFVGASTHPGTGMPTALISARLTARRMLEDFGV